MMFGGLHCSRIAVEVEGEGSCLGTAVKAETVGVDRIEVVGSPVRMGVVQRIVLRLRSAN